MHVFFFILLHHSDGVVSITSIGYFHAKWKEKAAVTPTVSSNQQLAGTGVVWALARANPLRLHAYDATNLTVKLFDQPAGPWNSGGVFIEPTVIQGKVYVGSDRLLTVFGL